MQFFIAGLHVENLHESIAIPPIVVRVAYHQSTFSFPDIFAVRAAVLTVIVGVDGEDIVHYLESSSHHIDEANDRVLFLFTLISELANLTEQHTW